MTSSALKTGEVASRKTRLRWTAGGAYLDLKGTGFTPRRKVRIELGAKRLSGGRTDRKRRFTSHLTLPPLAPGRHRVRVSAGDTALVFEMTVSALPVQAAPVESNSTPPAITPPVPIVSPPPPPPAPQPTFPIRAAFYYPWFPEAWSQKNPITGIQINPYTEYHPALGFYNSDDDAVRRMHLQALEYAGIEAGIYSWWGQGHRTDLRFPGMLRQTNDTASPVKWALYHEREGNPDATGSSDPTVAQIAADLDYIKANYTGDPAYLKVDGEPVIFVYADGGDLCPMADRWAQANTPERGFYVVLKVFGGYRACSSQPQSWHQYAPSSRSDHQGGYSFAISPGFHRTGDPADSGRPYLERNLAEFQRVAGLMAASAEPWQLVVSFNEWGENTATESASADEWASASGYGQYLDVLAAL